MQLIKYMKKGQLTLGIGLVGGLLAGVIGGMSVYFGTISSQNDKIAQAKTEVISQISDDREKIAALQTDSANYKEDIREIKGDIKQLLQVLGVKQ